MRQGQLPVNFQFKQSPPRLNDGLTPVLNDKVKGISRTSMNLENLLCLVQWGSSWLAKVKTRRGMHREQGGARDRKEGGLPGLLRLRCWDVPVSPAVAFRLASVPGH